MVNQRVLSFESASQDIRLIAFENTNLVSRIRSVLETLSFEYIWEFEFVWDLGRGDYQRILDGSGFLGVLNFECPGEENLHLRHWTLSIRYSNLGSGWAPLHGSDTRAT